MKSILCTIMIMLLLITPCYAGSKAKSQIKKGNVLYNKGEFSEALREYEEALREAPESDIVNFNLGTALYKTQDYKRAIEHFQRSLVSNSEAVELKASYNLGNAKYKFGISKEDEDLAGAVELLKESVGHYERAIEFDFKDEDAKYNYEFVQKELKRLEEKLQQQEKQHSQQDDKKKEQEEKKQDSSQQQSQQQEEQQEQQQQTQQDKAEEESGQEQEQPQKQEEASQKEEEGKDSASQKEQEEQKEAASQKAGEMSEKEAAMLLDAYRNEEEPKGLYKGNMPTHGLPKVLKDW